MGIEFTIREAVFDDAPAIAHIHYSTWLHAYREIIPDAELDSLNLESLTDNWQEILRLISPKGNSFVAVNNETIIAYSRFYPTLDSDDDRELIATIGSIYVHPDFQHRGAGRALIEEISRVAKIQGFKGLTLHVLVANERARSFYEFLGWEEDLVSTIEGSDEKSTPKVRYRTALI